VLQTPSLSTYLVAQRQDVVADFVRLSGQLPLHVMSGTPTANPTHYLAAYEVIFHHFHRVSDATIALNNDLIDRLCSPAGSGIDTSHLQALQLTFYSVSYHHWNWSSNNRLLLPEADFSSLKSFTCIGGDIRLCKRAFSPSLRALTLRHLDFESTTAQLIAVLANLQYLESLVIHWLIKEPREQLDRMTHHDGSPAWTPSHTATFPRLQRLDLSEPDPAAAAYFLHHLIFPADAYLKMTCGFSALHNDFVARSPLVVALKAKLSGTRMLGIPNIQYVSITTNYESGGICAKLWSEEPGEAISPILEFQGGTSHGTDFLTLLTELPMGRVTRLRIEGRCLPGPPLLTFIHALPSLEQILINPSAWDDLRTILAAEGPGALLERVIVGDRIPFIAILPLIRNLGSRSLTLFGPKYRYMYYHTHMHPPSTSSRVSDIDTRS
jgi:hypothetical protein